MITIKQNTNTLHTLKYVPTIKGVELGPDISNDWVAFSVYLVNKKSEILLKWNWQKDNGLKTGYLQATLGAAEYEIIIPFSQASTISLEKGKHDLILKYTENSSIIEESDILRDAVNVISTPAKALENE
jgi:hypothetical protein